ncbi:MAG: redoxin domain-containing protein [Actinomycetota bacterium]
MDRTQWLAAAALVAVVVGLIIGRMALDDQGSTTVEAGTDASGDAAAATDEAAAADTTIATTTTIAEPERFGPAGDLVDLDGWLQTDAESFADFDGQVRIVKFWTFACFNCKNTVPHLRGIYERWQPEGLEIIGVHAPEFDFEKDPEAIQQAAIDQGIPWPIALDTRKRNFRDWQPGRRFWPRTFVVDQNGEIRYDHIGEGRYDELEATVAYLIENGA